MRGYIGFRQFDYSVNALTIKLLHFGVDYITLFEIEIFTFTAWLGVSIENEKYYEMIEKVTEG